MWLIDLPFEERLTDACFLRVFMKVYINLTVAAPQKSIPSVIKLTQNHS